MRGRFAIPEKLPFCEEEIAVPGRRATLEPLPGVDSHAHAHDGSRREPGGDSMGRGDLVSTMFAPICFLQGDYFFSVATGSEAGFLRNPRTCPIP